MESNIILQNDNEDMIDLRKYIHLLFKWWWLIILVGLVTGILGYFISKSMTPYYSASATALVNQAPATQTIDNSSVMMSERLAKTYAQMMSKGSVLDQVIEQLNLTYTEKELAGMLEITTITNTQLIEVKAEAPDPNLSALIANSVVAVFQQQIEEIQGLRYKESKESLLTQMAELDQQISNIQTQIEQSVLPDELDKLEQQAAQYNTIYGNLLQSYEQIRVSEAQAISSVVQVEAATPEPDPVRPKTLNNTVLAAFLGGLLVIGVIFVREAFDDTIRTTESLAKDFKLTVLGSIFRHSTNLERDLILIKEPRSPVSEAYRSIRTSINYASVDKPLRTFMVTSTDPGEGKTTTLGNLAVAFAQTNKKILAVDCDLRKPHVHTEFDCENTFGLSNLLTQEDEISLEEFLQPSVIDNLKILTSGPVLPNPSEWLGSNKMKKLLKTMNDYADIVILDTPPTMVVTDASVLAPQTDGVVMVVRFGQTHRDALNNAIGQMRAANAKILGVVLNDMDLRQSPYAYRYGYKSKYGAYNEYYGTEKEEKKGFLNFFKMAKKKTE